MNLSPTKSLSLKTVRQVTVNSKHLDSDSDEQQAYVPEERGSHLSAQGRRQMKVIGQYVLMKYFFPELKGDLPAQNRFAKLFFTDMQFDLSNGKVAPATRKLSDMHYRVSPHAY